MLKCFRSTWLGLRSTFGQMKHEARACFLIECIMFHYKLWLFYFPLLPSTTLLVELAAYVYNSPDSYQSGSRLAGMLLSLLRVSSDREVR